MSDGEPTYRLEAHDQWVNFSLWSWNYKYGNGQDDANNYNIDEAVKEIKNMNVSQFYVIGLGASFNKSNLTKLNNAVNAAVKADDVYTTQNSSGLEAIFKAIAGKINNIACKDVKITDTINTQYAQVVTQTNGNPTKLTITVKKADGTVVESGENSITLGATELNKEPSVLNASYQKNQLVLDFPDKYQLEDGWTYTITTQVKPTQAAYKYYSDKNGSYPNIGDTNTGTHSGEPGFWSNTSAVLDYTVSGTEKHATYAQPVIQVKAGTLKITKNISGLTSDQIASMKDDMTFTIKKDNKPYKTIQLSAFDLKDRTYTYEMPYCVPGATYTVTESNMAVEGFDCATKVNGTTHVTGSATIVKGETKTIDFTNDYTPSTQDLTITKAVEGGDSAHALDVSNITYTFEVSAAEGVNANGDYAIANSNGKVTFTNGKASVLIPGTSSITIKGLPVGTYTVTETGRSAEPTGYEFDNSTVTKGEAVLTSNIAGQVTITNKYKIKTFDVTVVKEVTGNMGDTNKEFAFNHGNDPEFYLKDKGTKVFTDVKYGTKFTVSENDYSNDGYTTSYKVNNGDKNNGSACTTTVTSDTTITFVNDKTIQPPNGITTTIAPYAIMVVLAAGAGVYFVYSRRRRNR